MNYLFIIIIIFGGGGWGGQTAHWNSELEMPSLRNPRVQMATGHDILCHVLRERRLRPF